MRAFFVRWVATTFAVFVATWIVPGMRAEHFEALIWAGLLLGILNAVVRPVLLLLSLPFIVLTFGLAIPLINALLLNFVGGGAISGFHVASFGSALIGAIVISIVSWAANGLIADRSNIQVRGGIYRPEPTSKPGAMKSVQGRVIEHESDRK